jgi:hypothetical protein
MLFGLWQGSRDENSCKVGENRDEQFRANNPYIKEQGKKIRSNFAYEMHVQNILNITGTIKCHSLVYNVIIIL